MDSVNLRLISFNKYGYLHNRFSKVDKLKNFYNYTFTNCNAPGLVGETATPKEAQKELEDLHKFVGKDIIKPLFPNYNLKECAMWDGVDKPSTIWHNDNVNNNGYTNLLIYLDDCYKNNNSIEIKNKYREHKIKPLPGEYVWLNQSKEFQHRATHTIGKRRVLSFEFEVLNNV